MLSRILLITWGFTIVFSSCEPPTKDQRKSQELQEEIENREIKKVSEGDISAAAEKLGAEIAMSTKKTLASNLKRAIQNEGVASAIEFCNIAAYPLVDSLQKKYNAQIRRTTLKTRNPNDKPNELERQILEAYQYNFENEQPLTDNIQEVDDQFILYTKPISIENALCLNCHGEVGKQVALETYELIKKLYPEDEAVGYQQGDFRGMWSIMLDKREIVKSL